MIYTCSLCVPARKALGSTIVRQSSAIKVTSLMSEDPAKSGMDVVLLGPKDTHSTSGQRLVNAATDRHKGIYIIYLYDNDDDADTIEADVIKKVKRFDANTINEVYTDFVQNHDISLDKTSTKSADTITPEHDDIQDINTVDNVDADAALDDFFSQGAFADEEEDEEEEVPEPVMPTANFDDLIKEDDDNNPYLKAQQKPMDINSYYTQDDVFEVPEDAIIPEQNTNTIENLLAKSNSFEDWNLFREMLNKESLTRNLIAENTEYVGLVQMLEALDKEIQTVWRNPALSAEQKFEQIKSIGMSRSVYRAKVNSINVEKAISIITTIILSAKRTVEDKLNSVDLAITKITTDKVSLLDTSHIDEAISERTKVQLELLNLLTGIRDLYASIHEFVDNTTLDLDKKLPSDNEQINSMLFFSMRSYFTPEGTADLAKKLMQALQNNQLVASQLEDSIQAVVDMLFELCEKDEEIIRYQQLKINMLKANRVEDVVVANTLLKTSMRLFVGADNSGRSATAITQSGVMARSGNTLIIDITGRSKFDRYGMEDVMSLDDFLASRPEKELLAVKSDNKLNPVEVQELIVQLKTRLNYYKYVNVIAAPEDVDIINQLAVESKAIFFITNCTPESMETLQKCVLEFKESNIARELVTIDAPVSPLSVADSIGLDYTITRVIPLPLLQPMRACAIMHDKPYEYGDIRVAFKEAFNV